MTDKINATQMIEALRQAVETRGEDYVYKRPVAGGGCFYGDQSNPSEAGCGVGLAIKLIDEKVFAKLVELEELRGFSFPASEISELDIEATMLAAKFQYYQDAEYTWGTALQRAEATHLTLTRRSEE